jgi:hypothetical protein
MSVRSRSLLRNRFKKLRCLYYTYPILSYPRVYTKDAFKSSWDIGLLANLQALDASGTTVSTVAEASPIHRDAMRIVVDTEALASQGSKPSSSDNDGSLSGSDPDPSSDDDGCSSEDEQGRSRTSKHSRWLDLDEQRLVAYRKEGKSWEWIFRKLPGRTRPAIRTRWNMVRPRGD